MALPLVRKLSVAALVILMMIAVTTWPVQPESWVQTHGSRLPSNLTEFQDVPVLYQKATFSALSPEVKASLWQARLLQLSGNPKLNEMQRVSLNQLANDLKPAAYVEGSAESVRFKNVCAAFESFPSELRVALGGLGDASMASRTLTTIRFTAARLAGIFHLDAGFYPACQCALESLCSGDCYGSLCRPTSGCGCLWLYECDGCDTKTGC
jgi:hypothetical protein